MSSYLSRQIDQMAINAKKAAFIAQSISEIKINKVLRAMAKLLITESEKIKSENAKDLKAAKVKRSLIMQ